MDQGPLVMEEIEAGAELAREFDRYAPVRAAFWLKASDDDHRYFYIASERISGANIDVGYGEVLRLVGEMRSHDFDPFRVKLISADDPLAKAAVEINERFPGLKPNRVRGTMFGGITIDDVYIYRSPLPEAVP